MTTCWRRDRRQVLGAARAPARPPQRGQKLDLRRVTNAQIISIQSGEGYTQYVLKGVGQEVRLGLLGSD